MIGEYGYGKTHLVELTAQQALERNFVVATTSLDLGEVLATGPLPSTPACCAACVTRTGDEAASST